MPLEGRRSDANCEWTAIFQYIKDWIQAIGVSSSPQDFQFSHLITNSNHKYEGIIPFASFKTFIRFVFFQFFVPLVCCLAFVRALPGGQSVSSRSQDVNIRIILKEKILKLNH